MVRPAASESAAAAVAAPAALSKLLAEKPEQARREAAHSMIWPLAASDAAPSRSEVAAPVARPAERS